jgi:hypothetical protein
VELQDIEMSGQLPHCRSKTTLFEGWDDVDDHEVSLLDRALAAASYLHDRSGVLTMAYEQGTSRAGYMFLRAVWEFLTGEGPMRDPAGLYPALFFALRHEQRGRCIKEAAWFNTTVSPSLRDPAKLDQLINHWLSKPRGAEHLVSTVKTLLEIERSW